MRYHIIAVLILSLALGYLIFSATENEIDINSTRIDLSEEEFDYYMNNFDSMTFTQTGVQQYRVQAERMTHYPTPDIALLDNPDFVVYQQQEPPWYISSETARIDKDQTRNEQRVELIDNVVIHRVDNTGREINIYTEFLTVYPDSKTLHTDRDVLMLSQGSEVTSTGMKGNLMTNHIELLENVRAYYE